MACLCGATTVYHGTHETLRCLRPMPVRNYNSIGAWFTSTPWHAATFYGPNVYAVDLPPGRYLEAHTDKFNEFFLNWPLAGKTLLQWQVDYLKKHAPGTPAYDVHAKAIIRQIMLDGEYIAAFRAMIERAGYQGIVWLNSRIDLRKGDPPHDVYVAFLREPLCHLRLQ